MKIKYGLISIPKKQSSNTCLRQQLENEEKSYIHPYFQKTTSSIDFGQNLHKSLLLEKSYLYKSQVISNSIIDGLKRRKITWARQDRSKTKITSYQEIKSKWN